MTVYPDRVCDSCLVIYVSDACILLCVWCFFFLMIRRPPRSTRTDTSFPTRRSSDLVTETNDALAEDPAKINADPEGEAWFFKLTLSNPSELDELMDEAAYRTFVEENH